MIKKETREHKHIANQEIYKILQMGINSMMQEKHLRTIAFTSVQEEDDKSIHICSIAKALVKDGKKVLLIDCDIKNPKTQEFFQPPGETTFRHTQLPRLHLLPMGTKVEGGEYMLDIEKLEILLDIAKGEYDLVLIDAPPAGEAAEGIRLAVVADGTVLCMTTGKTPLKAAIRLKERLDSVKARMLGVILEQT